MARMLALLFVAALALAGCGSGKRQAAADEAVAVNSSGAAANGTGPSSH